MIEAKIIANILFRSLFLGLLCGILSVASFLLVNVVNEGAFLRYKDPLKSLSGSRSVHAYPAKAVGVDALSDLAVIPMNASPSDLYSLDLSSSSSLKVEGPLVLTHTESLKRRRMMGCVWRFWISCAVEVGAMPQKD